MAAGNKAYILGIDIGSVSLSVVLLDENGSLVKQAYVFHKGKIREHLEALNKEFDLSLVSKIACSASKGINPNNATVVDPQVALIRAAIEIDPPPLSILAVGAEKFFHISLGEDRKYLSTRTNTSCAAGTGSFLEQQASRLRLSGITDLSDMALRNKGPVPNIASRCAVFAKTDLIHAQQKGYPLEAICDSLCKGLAENICDSLFNKQDPEFPMLFTGGVSKNRAVVMHLESILNSRLTIPENSNLLGAIGAALYVSDLSSNHQEHSITRLQDILIDKPDKKEFFHPPLKLEKTDFPDFSSWKSFDFLPVKAGHSTKVQTNIYHPVKKDKSYLSFLGIDIGSTSTKAILINEDFEPLAGFYTYTAGKPVLAVKAIFEAIDHIKKSYGVDFSVKGAGTTGSGRKFAGKIIGADCIIDEITSHARAAYHIFPETDTIIEIGGQDAKFTSMENGDVTFSQMNTVCAAGTGSFLEEMASKLECSLEDYQNRAMNVRAPIASDRCTVFMERDINQLLNSGYTVEELLATSLHSVAENYLQKVASEGSLGNHICFQGATAKNKALVAAFEQRLKKKIHVSQYCHLTGALGTAIITSEELKKSSIFRGIGLFKENIPLDSEICQLCSNNCHISIANVMGEKVAYGFMCGRDYDTQKYVNLNTSGFNLLEERKNILKTKPIRQFKHDIIIGLPASLHLFEDISFWKEFFNALSIKTITSEHFKDPLEEGKRYAGAEFCAPIDSMYGHAVLLAGKADYVFLPVILESKNKTSIRVDRNYCYYTQFSPSLIYTLRDKGLENKILSPHINFYKGKIHFIRKMHSSLKRVLGNISVLELEKAYEKAKSADWKKRIRLKELYLKNKPAKEEISVMLMGRPYVVLSRSLNKGIPDILSGMGVLTFFQDMLPSNNRPPEETDLLLKKVPWYFAAEILETAKYVAQSRNLYPVFITAFKCAPDSFIIEYFKKIFTEHKKPYLILQIDEHDSNIGYETRIESALRAFNNHFLKDSGYNGTAAFQLLPEVETEINNKTLLFPNWDTLVSPLLVANLQRSGVDARLLESSDLTVKKSMAHNTGQCLPLNIITQEYIEYMEKYNLDPDKSLLWMMESVLTCNLRMYPFFIKTILENHGNGLGEAGVYSGELSHTEISLKTTYHGYFAYMVGGLLRKMICRIRPYELNPGETDALVHSSMRLLLEAFLGKQALDKTLQKITADFKKIRIKKTKRPKVAIFGDFYVRDNNLINQDLIKKIEDEGGEVLTTPYSDYVKITNPNVIRRRIDRRDYLNPALYKAIMTAISTFEQKYYKYFSDIIGPAPEINPRRLEEQLKKFNMHKYQSGESYDNILKIFYIIENHPDVSLFIQTSPGFCCPSLVTEAMTHEITRHTGVPIVTITYDGTSEYKNDVIVPYLKYSVTR